MVHKRTRRDKRVLVIDFTYTKPDGTTGRYRRDAAVQTMAAAHAEETARKLGATLFGDPEVTCGPNGVPLRPTEPTPEPAREPTFGEVVERYFAEYAPSAMAPSTLDGYRSKLRAHFVSRFGELPVSEAFDIAKSREVDVVLVDAGASASTRRNLLLGLRSVARFAVEAKILAKPPEFFTLPRCGKRIPSAPPAEDVALLIEAARYPEHRLLFLLGPALLVRLDRLMLARLGRTLLDRRWRAHRLEIGAQVGDLRSPG